ncbi:MAG TPA: hypothetical protein VF077_06150 [Nitrospiraceae bacterium]
MPLSAEQVYNDLDGEEVKEILIQRFTDLLSQIPDMQRHITMPRVSMKLTVELDVWGRTPNALQIQDEFTIRMKGEASVNSNPLLGGFPADQIRDQHQLPVMEPVRTPLGIQDQPTVRTPAPFKEGGRVYAARVTLDRGGPVAAGFQDYQSDAAPILKVAADKNEPDRVTPGAIQGDFRSTIGVPLQEEEEE